jgi:serine kinase of HPr protein (carbohydrate metabolism regulator)
MTGPEATAPLALVQATCVLVGTGAVMIRGAPGSGKSALAAALIAISDDRRPVRLVGDDAVLVRVAAGRLVAFAPESIAGLIEMRGVGIVETPHEPRAVVRLVVDLVEAGSVERLPEAAGAWAQVAGVRLPCVRLPAGDPAGPQRVLAAVAALRPQDVCNARKKCA